MVTPKKEQCLQCCYDLKAHFWRRPTPKQIAAITVFVVAWAAIIVLTSLGYLQQWADLIARTLGLWGHAIFALLIIYTGLPFGYGWSFFTIASGYALGWPAVVTCFVGTVLGHILGFFVSRRWLQTSVSTKVDTLPATWRHYIELVHDALRSSLLTFILLTGLLRNCGALTFGLCNAIDAALTPVAWWVSLLGVLVASTPGLVLYVYIGTLASSLLAPAEEGANLQNATEAQRDEAQARETSVIVQICIAVAFLVLGFFYARHRLKVLIKSRRFIHGSSGGSSAAENGESRIEEGGVSLENARPYAPPVAEPLSSASAT